MPSRSAVEKHSKQTNEQTNRQTDKQTTPNQQTSKNRPTNELNKMTDYRWDKIHALAQIANLQVSSPSPICRLSIGKFKPSPANLQIANLQF